MKVIDANTGQELRVGQTFKNVNGVRTVLKITTGLKPVLTIKRHELGDVIEQPLIVRYMHPSYLFQRVAFLNS